MRWYFGWVLPFIMLTTLASQVTSFITPNNGSIKIAKVKHPLRTIRSPLKMSPDTGRKLATMGRIPWKKLRLNKSQGREIISAIRLETHPLDLSLMFILAFFSEKIGKFLFHNVSKRLGSKHETNDKSTMKKVDENLGQAGKLGLICFLLDVLEIVLEVAGIKTKKTEFSTPAARLLFATWVAFRARLYKRHFFEAAFDYASQIGPKPIKKVDIVDKITDFFLFAVLAFIWIDILHIKRGNALSSVFALGGAGTLALTLALQDITKRALNGLAISTSDLFNEGDKIILGDGTYGTVLSVGWLSTEMRADDEVVINIPNSQLSNIRVSNLSTMKISQYRQKIYFNYNYVDDIPELVKEIKKEIAESCDRVITDGSKTFRVTWTGYNPAGLEVVVKCKIRAPLKSNAYHEARQDVVEAIARAVRRKGVNFAPPYEVVLMGEDMKRFEV